MKFKNKNIKIGQVVRVVIKYNPLYHSMTKDREYVGFVSKLEDDNGQKSIEICTKRIKVNIRDKIYTEQRFWRSLKNIPQLIMQSNFGLYGRLWILDERSVKEIEILKEVKE